MTAVKERAPRTGGTGLREALPHQNPVHRPPGQEKVV